MLKEAIFYTVVSPFTPNQGHDPEELRITLSPSKPTSSDPGAVWISVGASVDSGPRTKSFPIGQQQLLELGSLFIMLAANPEFIKQSYTLNDLDIDSVHELLDGYKECFAPTLNKMPIIELGNL